MAFEFNIVNHGYIFELKLFLPWKIFIHNLGSSHFLIMSFSVKIVLFVNLELQGETWLLCCSKITFLHRRVGGLTLGRWDDGRVWETFGPVKSIAESREKCCHYLDCVLISVIRGEGVMERLGDFSTQTLSLKSMLLLLLSRFSHVRLCATP